MKRLFYYEVELRDNKGKLYVNPLNQNKITSRAFQFTDETQEGFVHLVCQNTYENYKAVCKEGTKINIEVRTFNSLTKTYPVAYSFYGNEQKFVKH